MRYLEARGILPAQDRKVWCFLGDGETDEPESMGAITMPVREKLDNLIFVINCNLQRLDGPVRGNGKIIQELEAAYQGAGWNVIKVVWGYRWDPLLARDDKGLLRKTMEECVDGEYQNFKAKGGAYTREHFFGRYPELKAMVANMSDEDIWHLNRGGHDAVKVYAAYHAAVNHKGRPTVILAKTVKGYGMGEAGEAQNITHQKKKLDDDDLKQFRDRFRLPVSDEQIRDLAYYKPAEDSEEMKYLKTRREKLGGSYPTRRTRVEPLQVPDARLLQGPARGERRPRVLDHDGVRPDPDRARARQGHRPAHRADRAGRGAHVRHGGSVPPGRHLFFASASSTRRRTPTSSRSTARTRRARSSRKASTKAARSARGSRPGTSYSTHGVQMIPFYIYYSMFGFQRVGDFAWAGGDSRSRGFLIGGTAGRTTLAGEGLQHQDGHSQLVATTIPNCRAYDPCYALRARGDHPGRAAPDGRGAGRHLLLHQRDERELRSSRAARGRRGRHPARHVSAAHGREGQAARAAARLGHDPARGARGRRPAPGEVRHSGRRLERHELQRAAPRRARRPRAGTRCIRSPSGARATSSRRSQAGRGRSSRRPTT